MGYMYRGMRDDSGGRSEWQRVLESIDAEDARRLLKLVRTRLNRHREAKLDALMDELYADQPTAVQPDTRFVYKGTEIEVVEQLHKLAKAEDRRGVLRMAKARLD